MRLTTKFSAFVTLLTGLTIFVTLLGCSLSFYNAIQYKFSHRVQAVATAIDTISGQGINLFITMEQVYTNDICRHH